MGGLSGFQPRISTTLFTSSKGTKRQKSCKIRCKVKLAILDPDSFDGTTLASTPGGFPTPNRVAGIHASGVGTVQGPPACQESAASVSITAARMGDERKLSNRDDHSREGVGHFDAGSLHERPPLRLLRRIVRQVRKQDVHTVRVEPRSTP